MFARRRLVMDLAVFRDHELPVALRALRDVVASSGTITPAEDRFLEIVAELHQTKVKADSLEPIALADVARVIVEPHQRKRVVQLALIAAMVEGDVTNDEAGAVKKLARALDVDEAGLKVLQEVAGNHRLLTRVDMSRRIFGKFGREAYDEEGLAGIRKMVDGFSGRGEDEEVAWKYKSLGLLPEGSFGRAFWAHCTSRKFHFPGEKGGIPERMVFHDFGHVLS